MTELLLLVHAAATLSMVGLIWFVQVVHYPLFGKVGGSGFREYELAHQHRTTLVVAPLMLVEALTAGLLIWLRPAFLPAAAVLWGGGLVAFLWLSTFFWQVPAHERLAKSFDSATHRSLVRSNWVRTAAWTVRGLLAVWMCWQLMTLGQSMDLLTQSAVR